MKSFFNKALSLAHSVPLKIKIMGIVVFFVSLLGFIVIMETRSHMKHVLSEQLEKRGSAIASDVAARSTNLLLVGDTFSLYEIARGLSSHYEDVRYLLIFDQNGQLVVHSFGEGVPAGLLDLRSIPTGSLQNDTLTLESEEGEILDVLVPIAEGKVGWVRIGMSEISILRSIDQLSQRLFITTVIISVFGLFGALVMSYIVTKPIRDLAAASKEIARGDFSQRVLTLGQDEITNLGQTFNIMASSIERSTKEREALVTELKLEETVRQELLKKVISAQEDERRRISRELHDETSQSLTSLILGLKLLSELQDPAKSPTMASELKDLASSTLQEVHRLAVELRPTVLDDMGLVPAIERFVNSFTSQYNIDVDLHVQNKINRRLPGEIEITLYRIVQEALTNVAKYAEALNTAILLELKPDYVNLIVEDDGCGFDVYQTLQSTVKDNHLGIAGMKERTALLGGEFTIESSPGKGTTVYARIPVERREFDTSSN